MRCYSAAVMTTQCSRARQPAGRRAGDVAAVPVDMTGMLLRGTTLKNSGRITGLVVYTGPESRIQMNAAAPPRKRGARSLSATAHLGWRWQCGPGCPQLPHLRRHVSQRLQELRKEAPAAGGSGRRGLQDWTNVEYIMRS
jgi:magnesium-transporting ATPase (P-type)